MLKNLIGIAVRNIFKNKRKTIAALLSISSGFIALNLFQAYIYDSEILFEKTYSERNMFGDLLLRHPERRAPITKNQILEIEKFLAQNSSFIDTTTRFLQFSGTINNGQKQVTFSGLGYDIINGAKIRGSDWEHNTLAGMPLQNEDGNEVVIGKKLGESIGCLQVNPLATVIGKTGYKRENRPFTCDNQNLQFSLTTSTGQVNAIDAKVVGIMDAIFSEIDQRFVYAPIKFVSRLSKSDDLSFYAIKVRNPKQIEELVTRFKNDPELKSLNLELKPWQEFEVGDFYVKSMEFLHVFRNLITAVIILIGTLSVKSTFFRLVFERRREIGTLLSIGFKRIHVYILFFVESLTLSTLGVLIGIVFSIVTAFVINILQIPYQLGVLSQPVAFAVTIDGQSVLFSGMVLIAISVLACFYPVYNSVNSKIIEILRE